MSEPERESDSPMGNLLRGEARELLRLLEETSLSELLIEDGETRIHLRRSVAVDGEGAVAVSAPIEETPAPGLFTVTAPVVGQFSLSPEDAERLQPGHVIAIGEQLGTIESMRVPHEVHAAVAGELVEVLVKDRDPVEYGQPLFVVRPEA